MSINTANKVEFDLSNDFPRIVRKTILPIVFIVVPFVSLVGIFTAYMLKLLGVF
jgi:hypothetical protein